MRCDGILQRAFSSAFLFETVPVSLVFGESSSCRNGFLLSGFQARPFKVYGSSFFIPRGCCLGVKCFWVFLNLVAFAATLSPLFLSPSPVELQAPPSPLVLVVSISFHAHQRAARS